MTIPPIRKFVGRYFWLGLAVFAVGLVWNFPYETLKGMLISRIQKATGYQVDMQTLSPALPLGVSATQAHISGPPLGSHSLDVRLDSIRVTVSPFSLLTFLFRRTGSLSFSAEVGDSTWSGDLGLGKENVSVDLRTKDFKLKESIGLAQLDPTWFQGQELKIDGSINLSGEFSGAIQSLDRTDFSAADAKVNLTSAKTTIEAPFVGLLQFEKLMLDATMEKGNLEIRSLTLTGPTLSGKISGTMKIEPFWLSSQAKLEMDLKIDEKATDLRSKADLFLGQYSTKVGDDGSLRLRITGPIGQPANLTVAAF